MFNFKTLGDLFAWQKRQEEQKITPQPEPQPEPKPDVKPAPKARAPRKSKENK